MVILKEVEVTGHVLLGNDFDLGADGKKDLENAIIKANIGVIHKAKVSKLTRNAGDLDGEIRARVRVVGDAPPMDECRKLAMDALERAAKLLQPDQLEAVRIARREWVTNVDVVENARERVLAIPRFERVPASRLRLPEDIDAGLRAVAARTIEDVAKDTRKVRPPANDPDTNLDGCEAQATGDDPILNRLKNRADTGRWKLVTLDSIAKLQAPPGVGSTDRSEWSKAQSSTVAKLEGLPVQVVGWIALLADEGPEACNCCAKQEVDYHLLLVADAETAKLKNKAGPHAVVAEVTPRVRRVRPSLDKARLKPVIEGAFPVRVSGWLMLDQEHDEGLGKHRATLWEIHPIMEIDVLVDDVWVPIKDFKEG
ncbi:MAG TPA: hypothetical protein VGE04_09480 [Chloroflexia bacterium]|jgi:hypothetical protein